MKPSLALATRLTLLFILFALAMIGGVGWLSYASGRDSLHSATVSELHATAIEKQAALNAWVEDRQATVATLATSLSVREILADYTAASPATAEAQSAHARLVAELQVYTAQRQFLMLMLIEPAGGQVIAATNIAEEGKFREDQPYLINGKNGPFVQNLYYSPALQAPAMTVSAPILDADGRLLGVLAGRLNLDEMNAIINRRSGLRRSDEAFLVNTSNLFATQPRLAPDQAVLQRGVHTEAVNRCLERNSGVISALDYRGVPALVAYRWLPERGLCLIVKMDEAEALAPVRAFGETIILVGGITLLVAFFLAINLARSITRPILLLQEGAVRFGKGESDVRLPVTSRDELGRLSQTFNEMADALAERTNQLLAANKELEAFSYSVSHDLRAPLRAIDGFSRILLEKHTGSLDSEGARYFQLVRDNARQMGQLVDDLLAFSRLGRQALTKKPVSPRALVNQAVADLQAEIDGRKMDIAIADLPECQADPSLLKQVFANLLANAVKFTRVRQTAHIEIGGEQKDGEIVYFVRDNGVGFDMRYVNKLFGVFQRLHSAEEFEGTGVGLAIVQRIVLRHGGRVWAEAELDKGATFYFAIGRSSQ